MSHDRLIQAIGRIERALARLANVDKRPKDSQDVTSDLIQRHERLRAESKAVLGELDGLLSTMERN
jgi:hypothetical protein